MSLSLLRSESVAVGLSLSVVLKRKRRWWWWTWKKLKEQRMKRESEKQHEEEEAAVSRSYPGKRRESQAIHRSKLFVGQVFPIQVFFFLSLFLVITSGESESKRKQVLRRRGETRWCEMDGEGWKWMWRERKFQLVGWMDGRREWERNGWRRDNTQTYRHNACSMPCLQITAISWEELPPPSYFQTGWSWRRSNGVHSFPFLASRSSLYNYLKFIINRTGSISLLSLSSWIKKKLRSHMAERRWRQSQSKVYMKWAVG